MSNRLIRFGESAGIPPDYVAIEGARADRMGARAEKLLDENDALRKQNARLVALLTNMNHSAPEVAAAITECAAAQVAERATAGPDACSWPDTSEPPSPAPPAPIDPESQLYRSLLKSGVSSNSRGSP